MKASDSCKIQVIKGIKNCCWGVDDKVFFFNKWVDWIAAAPLCVCGLYEFRIKSG